MSLQDKEKLVNILIELLSKKLRLVSISLDDTDREELEDILHRIIAEQEEAKWK